MTLTVGFTTLGICGSLSLNCSTVQQFNDNSYRRYWASMLGFVAVQRRGCRLPNRRKMADLRHQCNGRWTTGNSKRYKATWGNHRNDELK